MHGGYVCAIATGVERAMRRGCDEWLAGFGLRHSRHQRVGHGALMCSVTAATGRQARIAGGIERGSERPEPEEQNEEDGERAPHLVFMLHE
jgi:hypothetical protein